MKTLVELRQPLAAVGAFLGGAGLLTSFIPIGDSIPEAGSPASANVAPAARSSQLDPDFVFCHAASTASGQIGSGIAQLHRRARPSSNPVLGLSERGSDEDLDLRLRP